MDGTVLNSTACRNCIYSGIHDVFNTFLVYYYCGGVGDALGWEVSRIFHNSLILSLGPWVTILLLFLIVNSCDFNTSVKSESHSLPIETSELCVRLGKIWTYHVS